MERGTIDKQFLTTLANNLREIQGTSEKLTPQELIDGYKVLKSEEALYTNLNEMAFGAGYTLTLNVTSTLMNDNQYTYSINDGYTWNKFNGLTITLQNVNRIQFKNDQTYFDLRIGSVSSGSDLGIIGPKSTSNNYIISSDTTYYLSVIAGGAN